MEINLSAEDQRLVDDLVAKGKFGSTKEVISAGLSILREHTRWLEEVRRKIDDGMAAAIRGDFASEEEIDALFAKYTSTSA